MGSLQKKNTGLFGNFFSTWGGGSSQFPKLKTKKKMTLKINLKSPKKQTYFFTKSPKKFHFERSVPKRGGVRCLGKIPKNPVFFCSCFPMYPHRTDSSGRLIYPWNVSFTSEPPSSFSWTTSAELQQYLRRL